MGAALTSAVVTRSCHDTNRPQTRPSKAAPHRRQPIRADATGILYGIIKAHGKQIKRSLKTTDRRQHHCQRGARLGSQTRQPLPPSTFNRERLRLVEIFACAGQIQICI